MQVLLRQLYSKQNQSGLLVELGESSAPDELSLPKEDVQKNKDVFIPLFGTRVSCGLFGISDDFIEKYQSLDARFIKNKASTFFFRASSDSMEPIIFENDILVVDRSIEAHQGRIVVLAYDGAMICKKLLKIKNQFLLRSMNQKYNDVLVNHESDVIVWGVVTAVARELI